MESYAKCDTENGITDGICCMYFFVYLLVAQRFDLIILGACSRKIVINGGKTVVWGGTDTRTQLLSSIFKTIKYLGGISLTCH